LNQTEKSNCSQTGVESCQTELVTTILETFHTSLNLPGDRIWHCRERPLRLLVKPPSTTIRKL